MRQRAALARALACDPPILLGDEPFGALDALARERLQDIVQRERVERAGRTTFLFATHNVREAVLLADRVLVMSAAPGRLLEEFRIDAHRPRTLDDVLVARVVSEIHDLLIGQLEGSRREAVDERAWAAAPRHRGPRGRLGDRRGGHRDYLDPEAGRRLDRAAGRVRRRRGSSRRR